MSGKDDKTMFSRSGKSNPFGKCTEELKTAVPERVKEQFTAVAITSGSPNASEYLRDVVMCHLYGNVDPNVRAIVWAHVEREVADPFIKGLLRDAIFGVSHKLSVDGEHDSVNGGNRADIGEGHGIH